MTYESFKNMDAAVKLIYRMMYSIDKNPKWIITDLANARDMVKYLVRQKEYENDERRR